MYHYNWHPTPKDSNTERGFPLTCTKLDPLPCLRKSHRIALTGVYKLSSISCREKCHDFDVIINAEVLPASGSMWQPLCYNKPRFPSYVRYKPSPSRQTIVSGSHVPRVTNEIDKMDHFNFWNIFTIPCASVMKNGWYTNYWQQLNYFSLEPKLKVFFNHCQSKQVNVFWFISLHHFIIKERKDRENCFLPWKPQKDHYDTSVASTFDHFVEYCGFDFLTNGDCVSSHENELSSYHVYNGECQKQDYIPCQYSDVSNSKKLNYPLRSWENAFFDRF